MEFDSNYTWNGSLRLATGRWITLDKLSQSRTYSGLIEGTPNKVSNDRSIQWVLDRAKRDNESLGEPLLIPPERREYCHEQGDMQFVLDHQQDIPLAMRRIPEWLPHIVCVGVFDSSQPVRNELKDASSLTIVWYQDKFGLDPRVAEQLREIDWDKHATDWEY